MSPEGVDSIRCSPTQERVIFVRPEKLFVLAACVAALPTTGFPYGGMYEKASSAAGRSPCLIALSVHGPVCACVSTADSKMNMEIRLRRIHFLLANSYRSR